VAFLENEFFQFLRHVIVAGIFGFLVARKIYLEKLKKKDGEIFILQSMLQALVPEEKMVKTR
jgi:hypothetical protein